VQEDQFITAVTKLIGSTADRLDSSPAMSASIGV